MAEDRTPDPADQPEDENTPPQDNPAEPYRLGGSGGSGRTPDNPSGSGGEPDNPFEAFLSSLAGGDMNALAAQLQSAFAMLGGAGSMFTSSPTDAGSGVNWEVTKDTARKTVAALGPDPSPDAGQRRAVTEAVELAEIWLDQATRFPRVSTTVAAWSRADWIEQTMPVWQRLVEPVALHIADAMEGALSFGSSEETASLPGMAGMEQMLRPMLRTSGASMFGLQLGQGLGHLATEVVGATDIGLPLSEPGHVALLPTNIKAFGEGLEQSSADVTLYLALRECARQRLFASAGWLRSQMLALVEQRATLERLETMLALVEGWVDEVVSQATAQWMPAANALAEAVRRARATGGPAEETFATLVGLELRPRRMRDAANLWAALRDARGMDGRDAVWSHPDLVPTSADLDDPLGFVAGETHSDSAANEDIDIALEELLKGEN